MSLTLEEAQTVITGAHEHAGKLGARVTVAIVDEGGHLQALGRMDGAPPLSAQIAQPQAPAAPSPSAAGCQSKTTSALKPASQSLLPGLRENQTATPGLQRAGTEHEVAADPATAHGGCWRGATGYPGKQMSISDVRLAGDVGILSWPYRRHHLIGADLSCALRVKAPSALLLGRVGGQATALFRAVLATRRG